MDPPLSPYTSTSSFSDRLRFFKRATWRHALIMSFQSLGVVYGRLSTAPLYVFGTIRQEDFKSKENVFEYFSFIFWTLTVISLLKHAFLVLRADDDGEGGPFALYSLLCRHAKVGLLPCDSSDSGNMHGGEESPSQMKSESKARRALRKHKSSHYMMLFLALFGACMIIGDGVLTPSISGLATHSGPVILRLVYNGSLFISLAPPIFLISAAVIFLPVLSASSGLQRSLSEIKYFSSSKMRDALKKYIPVPSACVILVCLFMLQHCGTRKLGFMFAPIVTVWLLFIGGVGIYNIFHCDPKIIYKASPVYMYRFVKNIDKWSWRSLGSILLCVAGSEAMFADLGHFSKKPIKLTFVCLVYPVLVICYAGQAAFISKNLHSSADFNHLSKSVPHPFRHVFILLSLLAAAVGSQATITASFSIIKQCLALGCFPRVKVIHTSKKRRGQVYIPDVNWLLMVLSLTVTIGFHDVQKIANAAGLAIVSGMVVTTCLMSLVIALCWEKSLFVSGCFLMFFGFVEAVYLSACMLSFHKGAWYLFLLLALSLTIMLAWHYGTMKKYEFDLQNKVSTEWLTDLSPGLGITRVSGIGLVYTDVVTGIPAFFSHFVTNLPAFHEVLIFVSMKSLPVPYVTPDQRYLVGRVGAKEYKIFRCVVRYGYCDLVGDADDFEEQIIHSIAEFISLEENDSESLSSPEGRMVVVGNPLADGNPLVPLRNTLSFDGITSIANTGAQVSPVGDSTQTSIPVKRKVRFVLPASSPKMRASVRKELQELIDARESGTAYFLGQSHLSVRDGSNFLKKFLVMTYVFLDKNCREPPVALNIPHAALVEVGMVYTL